MKWWAAGRTNVGLIVLVVRIRVLATGAMRDRALFDLHLVSKLRPAVIPVTRPRDALPNALARRLARCSLQAFTLLVPNPEESRRTIASEKQDSNIVRK